MTYDSARPRQSSLLLFEERFLGYYDSHELLWEERWPCWQVHKGI